MLIIKFRLVVHAPTDVLRATKIARGQNVRLCISKKGSAAVDQFSRGFIQERTEGAGSLSRLGSTCLVGLVFIWFLLLAWSSLVTPQAFVFGDEAGYYLPILFGSSAESFQKWGGVLMYYPAHLYFLLYSALPLENLHRGAKILNCVFIAASAVPAFFIARRYISPQWAAAFACFVMASPAVSFGRYVMPEATYFFGFWAATALFLCVHARVAILHVALTGVAVGALSMVKPHAFAVILGVSLAILWRPPTRTTTQRALTAILSYLVTRFALTKLLLGEAGSPVQGGAYSDVFGLKIDWANAAFNSIGHVSAIFAIVGILLPLAVVLSRSTDRSLSDLSKLALCLLVSMLATTIFFSQAVHTISPEVEKITRLHGRYYFYPLPLFLLIGMAALSKRIELAGSTWRALTFIVPACTLIVLTWYQTSPVDFPDLALVGNKSPRFVALAVVFFQIAIAIMVIKGPTLPVIKSAIIASFTLSALTSSIFVFAAPFMMPKKAIDEAFTGSAPGIQQYVGRSDGVIIGSRDAPGDLARAMFYFKSLSTGRPTDKPTISDADIEPTFRWAAMLPPVRYTGSRPSRDFHGIIIVDMLPPR